MVARDMATLPLPESHLEIMLPIGCSSAIGRDRLGTELVNFGRRRPDVMVGVHEMGRTDLLASLRAGEIALGLLPGDPDPGFRSAELWSDHALIALPLRHPLAGAGSFPPDAAREQLFLVSRRSAGAEVHRFLSRRLFGEGACLRSDMRDCGLGRILKLVADGQGAALLCDSHDYPARAEVALLPVAHARARFGVHAHWAEQRCDGSLTALLGQLRREVRTGVQP